MIINNSEGGRLLRNRERVIALISTGGTISTSIRDIERGLIPSYTAEELSRYILNKVHLDINITVRSTTLFNLLSENIKPRHWTILAKKIADEINAGVDGVIVTHGTDTLGYTSAALSFALQNLPVPVVIVGSMYPVDKPGSDAISNLRSAFLVAAEAPLAEVVVVSHEDADIVALYRGTRVRKCHTNEINAFKSINARVIGRIVDDEICLIYTSEIRTRNYSRKLILKPDFNDKVALIKFYPGMNSDVILWYVDKGYKGIILEGTGQGHVSHDCIEAIKYAIDNGVFIGMTTQCIWGYVNMNTYKTGRDLLKVGVTPLYDMIAETAVVKLMWVLAQTKELDKVKELMLANIAGELSNI